LSPVEITLDKSINIQSPEINIPIIPENPIINGREIHKGEAVQNFNLDISFYKNSTKINPDFSDEAILALLKTLVDYSNLQVLILGNASYDGKTEKSKASVDGVMKTVGDLQLARAKAIRKFLIDRGIDPNRLSVDRGKIENGAKSTTLEIKNP